MNKVWIFVGSLTVLIALAIIFITFWPMKKNNEESKTTKKEPAIARPMSVREPKVAGQFYPEDPKELKSTIQEFLDQAQVDNNKNIQAIIVPHAGYVYSGGVAAYGFKALEKQNQDIKTVILIGGSHHEYLNQAVIDSNDVWKTPLGQVAIDEELRSKLVEASDVFKVSSSPHDPEHSLEVEVPFLQSILGEFKILPILVSIMNDASLTKVSRILSEYSNSSTLFVISTDLSHYPSYENAQKSDQKVIQAVLSGDYRNLQNAIQELEAENIHQLDTCMCGQPAVEILMRLAQTKLSPKHSLLKYANSGDVVIGDKSQVVGYAAISLSWQEKIPAAFNFEFTEKQKEQLISIAKDSVGAVVGGKQVPKFEITDPILNEKLGAFVTLKKNGQLRGCIGAFQPDAPLYEVVSQMAMAAATEDPRFSPVSLEELNKLDYEVSVLSPLEKIDDWRKIQLGVHGVQVRKGPQSGVFLPQVATETQWDMEQFMGELCQQKAGLPRDCWKQDNTDLYVFTAEVFGEE